MSEDSCRQPDSGEKLPVWPDVKNSQEEEEEEEGSRITDHLIPTIRSDFVVINYQKKSPSSWFCHSDRPQSKNLKKNKRKGKQLLRPCRRTKKF